MVPDSVISRSDRHIQHRPSSYPQKNFQCSKSVEQLDPRLIPVLKSSLLFREQWIDNWLYAIIDKPLEDLVGNTEQRYWSIIFWVPNGLHWLWDCNYKCSSLDLGNFELAQAGRKDVT